MNCDYEALQSAMADDIERLLEGHVWRFHDVVIVTRLHDS